MQFFPSSGCVDTNKTYGEKAWQQLHKNAESCIEQVLEAASNKTAAMRPPTTHHENYPSRHVGHSWRSKDELISNILLWTPSHEQVKAGQPARNYIQQLCADTGYNLEDLPGVMNNRDGWWEKVRKIHAGSTTWWW